MRPTIGLFFLASYLLVTIGTAEQITSEPILDFGFAQSNVANSKIVAYATTPNQVILLPIDLTSGSHKLTPEPSIPVTNVKRVAVYDQKLAYLTKGDVIHILNDWEFNPTRPTLTLSPPRRAVADLWFSEENLHVGLVDGTVLVYDSKSMNKRPIHTIGSNHSYIDLIRFNSVHQQFLIYSRGSLSLWNFATRRSIWQTGEIVQSITSVRFSQTGDQVALQSGNQIFVYPTTQVSSLQSDAQAVAVFDGKNDPISAFCFGARNTLLTIQQSGRVKKWTTSTQSSQEIQQLPKKNYTNIAYLQSSTQSGRSDWYLVTTDKGAIVSYSMTPKRVSTPPKSVVTTKSTKPKVSRRKPVPVSTGQSTQTSRKTQPELTVKLTPKPPYGITIGQELQIHFHPSQEAVILPRQIPTNANFIADERTLSWQPTRTQVGSSDFQFYAITEDNLSQPISFSVTVGPNQPPRFVSVGGQPPTSESLVFTVAAGEDLNQTLVAEDPESDQLVFSISQNPPGMVIENISSSSDSTTQRAQLKWVLDADQSTEQPTYGVFPFQIRLNDGFNQVDLSVQVSVQVPPGVKDVDIDQVEAAIDTTKGLVRFDKEMRHISVDQDMVLVSSDSGPDFFIDQYEVTNQDFVQFLNQTNLDISQLINLSTPYAQILTDKKGFQTQSGKEQYPVVGVSWFGANQFAKWEGKTLPTVAQWEAAAYQKDGRLFPWGSEPLDSVVIDWRTTGPTEVGILDVDSSPFGVFDLATNVAEWTSSEEAGKRIVKGGSWKSRHPDSLRTDSRLALQPDQTLSWIGFRCVRLP